MTGVTAAQYSLSSVMRKRLTAFVLLAVVTGGLLAGVPLHSGEHECGMADMPGCCATARTHRDAPEVFAARLCCALNCTEPGTAAPTFAFRVSPQAAVFLHHALAPRTAVQISGPSRFNSPPLHTHDSQPAYIRHLALLI